MKRTIFLFLSFLIIISIRAQRPIVQWQKCYGGLADDKAYSIALASDGGYVVVGSAKSNNGDVIGNQAFYGFWVVKLTSQGDTSWQRCLGGTTSSIAYSIESTMDGGYVITGFTDGLCVIKMKEGGEIEWEKKFGGTGGGAGRSVKQTREGGYIVAGYSASSDGEWPAAYGSGDYVLIKLNSAGNLEWANRYGGSSEDLARSVAQTADGGYVINGETFSNDRDVTGHHGGYDEWVVKVDSLGNLQWQKCLGGSDYADYGYSVCPTPDSGCVVSGSAKSNDGDVTCKLGLWDYWIVKLDKDGVMQWQKCFGGTNGEKPHCIRRTVDGGFIVAGESRSDDGDITESFNIANAWIVKLDSDGNKVWQKLVGAYGGDYAYDIRPTTDGGYIVAGESNSNFCHNGSYAVDYWVFRLGPDTNCKAKFTLYPSSQPHSWFALNQTFGQAPINYKWNWGDGTAEDTIAYPTHIYNTPGYYPICVTIRDSVGCTHTFCDSSTYVYKTNASMVTINVVDELITHIDKENMQSLFSVYPNPAQNLLTVLYAATEQKIILTNLLGEVLYQEIATGGRREIDVSHLPSGMYFVNNRKFVKE